MHFCVVWITLVLHLMKLPDFKHKWRLPLTPQERNALLLAIFLFLLGLAVRIFRHYYR